MKQNHKCSYKYDLSSNDFVLSGLPYMTKKRCRGGLRVSGRVSFGVFKIVWCWETTDLSERNITLILKTVDWFLATNVLSRRRQQTEKHKTGSETRRTLTSTSTNNLLEDWFKYHWHQVDRKLLTCFLNPSMKNKKIKIKQLRHKSPEKHTSAGPKSLKTRSIKTTEF